MHDVGTGTGLFSRLLSPKVGVQGADLSVDESHDFHRVDGRSTDWMIGREVCDEIARESEK